VAADLGVVQAELALEDGTLLVVELVDPVTLALARGRGADHADLVLLPLVVEDVAALRAGELAPGALIGALPAAHDRRSLLDEVEVAVDRVEIDPCPALTLGHRARLHLGGLGLLRAATSG